MKSNKKILGGILVVVIMLFGLSFLVNQKVIFAEDSNVFYVDDLAVGDYIPYGATIIAGQDFSNSGGGYVSRVDLGFVDKWVEFDRNGTYTVEPYAPSYGYGSSHYDGAVYTGWVVDRVQYEDIHFIPSSGGVVETAKPSESNDYTLKLDGEINEIKWYKYEDLENFSTDSNNSLWTKDGDTWIFRNFETSPATLSSSTNTLSSSTNTLRGSTNTLKASIGYKEKVTFDVPAGEKLYIGEKHTFCGNSGCNSFNGKLDENSILSIGNSNYNWRIVDLEGTENHTLTFEYGQQRDIYSYFHLDAMTLTDLNQSEATLDTTDLQDGDKVFYIAKSGTQTFKGKLIVKKESEPIKVNPATSNSILNYIILGIISISVVGLCIGYSKKFNI